MPALVVATAARRSSRPTVDRGSSSSARDRATLRRRPDERSARFDANAAFPITDDLLDAYLRAFEAPDDESTTIR
jgi:hypothetical protein